MKAVKILSLIAALLMCLSLAACYQQTDVLEGVEEKENVLTADPNYAAPAQQENKTELEPEPETGSTSAPTTAPNKTDAASPEAPKDTETATDEPTVPPAEEGEIVVDVKEEIIDPERLPEAQAAQKQQTTIGEIINQDIQSVTLKTKIGFGAIGSWGEYASQPVGIEKWEAFVQTVNQETWGYHYCPGGNGLLTSPWNNDYVVIVTDADGREYAVHFWGSNWITTLAVPEGRTYDEFREENLRSNEAPMLFAHYTVDFDFYDQLLEIFTK